MISVGISDEDVRAIAQDPSIFPDVSDDGTPEPGTYQRPGAAQGWINICIYVDEQPAGYLTLIPRSTIEAEGHFAVLPAYRKQRMEIGKAAIRWAAENTRFRKLTGQTASDKAIRYLLALGFEVEGINRDSLLRGGVIHSQTYLGLQLWQVK